MSYRQALSFTYHEITEITSVATREINLYYLKDMIEFIRQVVQMLLKYIKISEKANILTLV